MIDPYERNTMAEKKSNPAADEIRSKMREALDRKQGKEREARDGATGNGAQKPHGVDHPVGHKEFRRKSGG